MPSTSKEGILTKNKIIQKTSSDLKKGTQIIFKFNSVTGLELCAGVMDHIQTNKVSE